MNKILMDKRADEKIISLWWIFIFAMILVAIVASVIIYYSTVVDVRQIESDTLNDRIAGCIMTDGSISELMETNFDISSKCSIIGTDYYAKVEVYNASSCEGGCRNPEKSASFGNNYETYCDLQKQSTQDKLPKCTENYVYAYYNSSFKVIRIVTASNQKSGEIWKS